MTTCSRPTCTRTASGPHGYCNPHAYATGAIQPRVPATLAQAIIRRHMAEGHTLQGIANATGLADSGLRKILAGDRDTVRAHTIRALRDVVFDGVPVPAWRIARRVQALMAAGWEQKDIAAATGITKETLRYLRTGVTTVCYPRTAGPLIRLYAEHEHDPVGEPSQLARQYGWVPPAAWDDIDDPQEQPARPPTVVRWVPVTAVHLDALRALHGQYRTWAEVAGVLGTTRAALKKVLAGETKRLRGEVVDRLNQQVGSVAA